MCSTCQFAIQYLSVSLGLNYWISLKFKLIFTRSLFVFFIIFYTCFHWSKQPLIAALRITCWHFLERKVAAWKILQKQKTSKSFFKHLFFVTITFIIFSWQIFFCTSYVMLLYFNKHSKRGFGWCYTFPSS